MWMAVEWYLVRTKAGEERRVNEHLTGFADETLLPLIKLRVRRWGNLIESIAPLFANCLFAVCSAESNDRTAQEKQRRLVCKYCS